MRREEIIDELRSKPPTSSVGAVWTAEQIPDLNELNMEVVSEALGTELSNSEELKEFKKLSAEEILANSKDITGANFAESIKNLNNYINENEHNS